MSYLKKSAVFLLVVLFSFTCLGGAFAGSFPSMDSYVFVVSNDEAVSFPDSMPEIRNGVTYVPVRFFAESLGATVGWDEPSETASVSREGKVITINRAQNTVTADGSTVHFDMFTKDDRIMVPYRYIAEAFGYQVSYIDKAAIARISNKAAQLSDEEVYEKYIDQILTEKETLSKELGDKAAYAEVIRQMNERFAVKKQREEEKKAQQAREELMAKREEINKKYADIEQDKVVYLTMDDGPVGTNTKEILDIMYAYDMHYTFFMTGNNIKNNPDIVKRMADEGHGIGVHSVTHDRVKTFLTPTTLVEEFEQCNDYIEAAGVARTKLCRVPYGSGTASNEQYENLVEAGYQVWDWHIDPSDYAKTMDNKQEIYDYIVNALESGKNDGVVILMHDQPQTKAILPDLLDYLRRNGYKSMPLTEDLTPYNARSK